MPVSENPREILARLEAAAKRDLRDALSGLLLEHARRGIQPAAREVFHRRHVHQFPTIAGEMRAPESAGLGHGIQRPRFVDAGVQRFEEQAHRALAARQGLIEQRPAAFQQFREQDDEFIDEDFQLRAVRLTGTLRNGFIKPCEAVADFGIRLPDRLLVLAQRLQGQ